MESASTPMHRAILRPTTTYKPSKILPGAHKPRPAPQPSVDEILNKTARGEQIEQTPRHGQRRAGRSTPSTPQFAQPRVDTGRGTRRVHGQIVDATLRGELTNMLDRRDADPEEGGWHPVADEGKRHHWHSKDTTPEKQTTSNNLNVSALSGAPTPPSYSRPGTAACPSTRPGTASTACSSSGWDRGGFREEESSIISGLAKTGDGRRALINMLQSQMRAESQAVSAATGSTRPCTGSTIIASDPLGGAGAGMTEREAVEAKHAAYRAELDAQIMEQARLRSAKPECHQAQQGFFWAQPNHGASSSSPPTGGPATPLATPYALADDASPSNKVTAASADEMELVKRNVRTMHWGERQVQGWKEKEDRQRRYREELALQVEEKRLLSWGGAPTMHLSRDRQRSHGQHQRYHEEAQHDKRVVGNQAEQYHHHEEDYDDDQHRQQHRQVSQVQRGYEKEHRHADVWQASSPQTASSPSHAADMPTPDRFAAAHSVPWRGGESAPWDSHGPLSLRCDSSGNCHGLEDDGAYGCAENMAFTACIDADQVLEMCRDPQTELQHDLDATPPYSPRGDDDATPRSSARARDEGRYTSDEYRAIGEKLDQLQQEVMRQKTLIDDLTCAPSSAPSRKAATPAQARSRAAVTPSQWRSRSSAEVEQERGETASSTMIAKRRAARNVPLWQPRSR